jgi:hypothetical protein
MEFEAISDLDGCGLAFECVDLRVACAELEPIGIGEDAALQSVVAVLHGKGDAHGCTYEDRRDGGDRKALLRLGTRRGA